VTYDDWRLPATGQPDPTCDQQLNPGGGQPLQGHGDDCTGSELGHLFYVDGISYDTPGIFINVRTATYWSGTTFAPDSTKAWAFVILSGSQTWDTKAVFDNWVWAVRDGDVGNADSDGDGLVDAADNCRLVPNNDAGVVPGTSVLRSQLDADGDGYGNMCDGDLNQTNLVTSSDYTTLRNRLNTSYSSSGNSAEADMNGSGLVTAADYTMLRNRLNTAPGPSGYGCGVPAGSVACTP
jgi:hypothetical protein